ncbi:kinesin-like protein KIF22-B [Rhopilema esculentum]|uniref:kinesin-like protein KIF22-B n=1 Tax=Rhopilema esculentum TaxID=499914 RepID=UPI0031DE8B43|eukprot:gene15627-6911_t
MGSRVKVFIRLRPVMKKENEDGMPQCCAKKATEKRLQLWNYRNPNSDVLEYEFDKVFSDDAAQSKIYEDVKSLVPNVLNGQNATIFGYGPTGAGKTHTIVGSREEPGLIPRCINYVFMLMKARELESKQKETFSVHFSMLEIYQEKVYDLIKPKEKDLPIRQDATGNIVIPELTEVKLSSFNEFTHKYQSASNNRTIGSTKLNSRSSRSHTILLMKVVKTNADNPTKKYLGKLYLIDLAGSEDNRRTGNTGIRLKESGAINSSLFALSMVVDALNKGLHRIPYRDSKLTRLLQDSIGGTAHSLMIACIAPEPSFYWDTLNTLKFASKSREIVNKPFTAVIQERPAKRPHSSDADKGNPEAKRPLLDKDKNQKKVDKENQDATVVENLKKLLSPIGKKQQEFENNFAKRLKVLEDQLKTQMGKTEPKPAPLKESSKANVPVNKVRPLMAKSQPALCKTPCAGKKKIQFDSPEDQGTSFSNASQLSLPQMINGPGGVCNTPKYKITLDPKMLEEYEAKLIKTLSTGSIKAIMALPTIGKKRAEQIIKYRDENGHFGSISELLKVGFTKTMLETFRKKSIMHRLEIA